MLCQFFAVQQSDPVIHYLPVCLYIVFFFTYYLPLYSTLRNWIQFCVLYIKTSLLTHLRWNSLYLLTPNSPSIPLPPRHSFWKWSRILKEVKQKDQNQEEISFLLQFNCSVLYWLSQQVCSLKLLYHRTGKERVKWAERQ